MRRIYFIFLMRNIAPLAFDSLVVVVLIFLVRIFVSVRHVWANFSAANATGGLSSFSLSAVTHTELQTKILLLILGTVGFFAIRHLKRAWRAIRTVRGKSGTPKNP